MPRSVSSSAVLWVSTALVVAACGARTDINIRFHSDAGAGGDGGGGSSTVATTSTTSTTTSSSSGGCTADSECDDGVACTVDLCSAGACVSAPSDPLCDDGIACTSEQCNPTTGCNYVPNDTFCNDAVACTFDSCAVGIGCVHEPCDDVCSDGLFCNGLERCDVNAGCVGPDASPCDDGVPCSTDTCTEVSGGACSHGVPLGCATPLDVLEVVGESGELIVVSLPIGNVISSLPAQGTVSLDIARIGDRLFGTNGTNAYEIDPNTNKLIGTIGPAAANSLGAGLDGFLYYADTSLYRLDPSTGATTLVGALPPGHISSGDVAVAGVDAYVTTTSNCGYDSLVRVSLVTGEATNIGKLSLPCAFGLGTFGEKLYAFSCAGYVALVNKDTADTTIVATLNAVVYGAADPQG